VGPIDQSAAMVAAIAPSAASRYRRRPVIQVFIVFFILPEWGIQLKAFSAALLAMAIMGSAFICEIVAGGINAISKGQWEAGTASGLTLIQQLRLVIIPQAMRVILPPLVGQSPGRFAALLEQKGRRITRRGGVASLAEGGPGAGQSVDRQPVPGHDQFVVDARPFAAAAGRKQFFPTVRHHRGED